MADARELWRALWEAEQAPEAACNVGQLSSRMGELVTAREYLAICVRLDPGEAHRLELARVEARLGRLIVRTTAPDATVRVDGRELEPGVREAWVRAGDHLVEIERAGRRAISRFARSRSARSSGPRSSAPARASTGTCSRTAHP
ncbi:hypothetical protein WME94_52995 [Sorangium sp. So ce429]